jgi:replicative DNA helicase
MYHARIVEEKALLRQLINAATEIAGLGYEDTEEVSSILDTAEKRILGVSNRKLGQDFTPIKSIIFDAFNKIEVLYANKGGITGLSTGFKDLDRLTSGLQPSDLILIAARPSMGKTAFVLNIAQHIGIREKKAVAFFSLEMSKEQLVQRMLCAEAAIDSQRLRIGELEDNDWKKLVYAADRLSAAPIFIDDTAGISVVEMRAKARRLKIEHDLELIIIDYLQLMQGNSTGRSGENRQQEISEISRSLKSLARELNVPVIALSQLSRSVESRQVKKPMLSDLRESGSLEQDADIVSFLYRDDYYNPDTDQKNITEVILAKHRNGPVDTVKLFFHKQFTKFADLSNMQG